MRTVMLLLLSSGAIACTTGRRAGSAGAGSTAPAPTPAAAAGARPASIADSTLGTRDNPVLSEGPRGEREYLSRLRCADGAAPTFERQGSVGSGADGHIMDRYAVNCPRGGREALVFIDMYHGGYRELRSVPGFSMLPELPARAARGCPPMVVPDADSSARYVFDNLEVASPAYLADGKLDPFEVGVSGSAFVEFIVDTSGRAEEKSLAVRYVEREELRPHVSRAVRSLRFTPAEHHPGCKVRQRTGGQLEFK